MARANPLVAVFGLIAVLAALGLVLMRLFRRRGGDDLDYRAGAASDRPEPGFGRSGSSYFEDNYDSGAKGIGRPARPTRVSRKARQDIRAPLERDREGFGFGAVFFAFVFGLLIGGGALAFVGSAELKPAYKIAKTYAKRGLALITQPKQENSEPKKAERAEVEPVKETGTVPVVPRLPTVATAPDIPLGQQVEAYVKALAKQLPKRIDTVTSLVSATMQDDAILLGYAVAQSVPDSDSTAFADAMRAQIEQRTCSLAKTSEMRDLNDQGVEFRLVYSDQAGKTLAKINLPASFCGTADSSAG